MNEIEIKLTQYSHGAGCGCKISPSSLTEILKSESPAFFDKNLIVGNETRDDAAVYDIGNNTGIISTTDFFMPIVDDAFTFGKIAAVNAISDIYAMGGRPIMAVAILGWPIDKLPLEVAACVTEGGRAACREAGIALAGGHSIDSPEPIFGLAVTGIIDLKKLKQNSTARAGSKLYLTKPLGVGLLSTAQKNGILKSEHAHIAPEIMMKLNSVGEKLAEIPGVNAMTDVTGFSLIGHLSEICESSGFSADICFDKIPKIDVWELYTDKKCIAGGNRKNRSTYEHLTKIGNDSWKTLLFDPQTSGGLLISTDINSCLEVEQILKENHVFFESFGELIPKTEIMINVS